VQVCQLSVVISQQQSLQNPRLGMLVKSFDKMTVEKRTAHLQNAEIYLEKLTQQHVVSQ
jgi:deoxyribodipyrimidine photolyase-related protein